MRFVVVQRVILVAWLVPLVFRSGIECAALPLREDRSLPMFNKPDSSEAVQDLVSLEKVINSFKESFGSYDGVQVQPHKLPKLEDNPSIDRWTTEDDSRVKAPAGLANHTERGGENHHPVVSQTSHGSWDEDTDWGSFRPVSSSSETGSDFFGDYDPLEGGAFTSEVIDPSVSHNVFAGSAINPTGSEKDIQPWNVDHTSVTKYPEAGSKAGKPVSENPEVSVRKTKPSEEDNSDQANAIMINLESKEIDDILTSNLLSAKPSKLHDFGRPMHHVSSQGSNGMGRQTSGVEVAQGDHDAMLGEVVDENLVR